MYIYCHDLGGTFSFISSLCLFHRNVRVCQSSHKWYRAIKAKKKKTNKKTDDANDHFERRVKSREETEKVMGFVTSVLL